VVERRDIVQGCVVDQYDVEAGLHERSELAAQVSQITQCKSGRGRRLERDPPVRGSEREAHRREDSGTPWTRSS